MRRAGGLPLIGRYVRAKDRRGDLTMVFVDRRAGGGRMRCPAWKKDWLREHEGTTQSARGAAALNHELGL